MNKYTSLFPIAFCCLVLFLFSCKSNQKSNASQAEVIFSLSTTPCYGECPVFELSLYGDKTLVYDGKEHTKIEGVKETQLTDDQFETFLGIIESSDWSKFEPSYTSDMTDLPTQNFNYNRNDVSKSVSKYGTEPRELSKISDLVLTFVEQEVFNER